MGSLSSGGDGRHIKARLDGRCGRQRQSESSVVTLASSDGDGLEEIASAFGDAVARRRHFDRRLAAVPA
jgi:hypothetical protein